MRYGAGNVKCKSDQQLALSSGLEPNGFISMSCLGLLFGFRKRYDSANHSPFVVDFPRNESDNTTKKVQDMCEF